MLLFTSGWKLQLTSLFDNHVQVKIHHYSQGGLRGSDFTTGSSIQLVMEGFRITTGGNIYNYTFED